MCLICLILFQADKWEQVSPNGTAPSARSGHRAEWDDAGGRLWISAGSDGSPSLNAVQQVYSTSESSVRFGAEKQLASSCKK